MALIKAKHAVYGEVVVPESYLRLWPDDYKSLDASVEAPEVSSPVEDGARTRTTNETKEQD